jgi:hypothetical protein
MLLVLELSKDYLGVVASGFLQCLMLCNLMRLPDFAKAKQL